MSINLPGSLSSSIGRKALFASDSDDKSESDFHRSVSPQPMDVGGRFVRVSTPYQKVRSSLMDVVRHSSGLSRVAVYLNEPSDRDASQYSIETRNEVIIIQDRKNRPAGHRSAGYKHETKIEVRSGTLEPKAVLDDRGYPTVMHNIQRLTAPVERVCFPGGNKKLPAILFEINYVKPATANGAALPASVTGFELDDVKVTPLPVESAGLQGVVGRFQTSSDPDSPYYESSAPHALETMTAVGSIGDNDVKEMDVIAHSSLHPTKPYIPIGALQEGVVFGTASKPSKILVGAWQYDLVHKTNFWDVFRQNGAEYVRLSSDAQKDTSIKNYQDLTTAPPGFLQNIRFKKYIYDNITSSASIQSDDKVSIRNTAVISKGVDDLPAMLDFARKTNRIFLTAKRNPKKEVDLEDVLATFKYLKSNASASLNKLSIFGCLGAPDAEGAQALSDNLAEADNEQFKREDFDSMRDVDLPAHSPFEIDRSASAIKITHTVKNDVSGVESALKSDDCYESSNYGPQTIWRKVEADGSLSGRYTLSTSSIDGSLSMSNVNNRYRRRC